MSQITATITPTVTVRSTGASTTTVTIMTAYNSVALAGVPDENDVVLSTLTPVDTMKGLLALLFCHRNSFTLRFLLSFGLMPWVPWRVNCSLSELSLPPLFYVSVCYGVCLLFPRSCVANISTSGCSTFWVWIAATLWSMLLAGICISWCLCMACFKGSTE